MIYGNMAIRWVQVSVENMESIPHGSISSVRLRLKLMKSVSMGPALCYVLKTKRRLFEV